MDSSSPPASAENERTHPQKRASIDDKQSNPDNLDELLQQLYYSLDQPTAFSGPYALYKEAKKFDARVKLRMITKWLSAQNPYTLHREIRLKFPRRKTIVHGVHIQYQADLLDVQGIAPENDSKRYILTVIDCFSRFAAGIPIANKKGPTVAEGLKKAFKKLGGPPLKLQTDHGTEFYNRKVKALLQTLGVKLFSSFSDVKAALVERFNRTLRTRLQKYFSANETLRYIEALDPLIRNYNHSIHRTLKKFSPVQVSEKNEKQVFEIQYREYLDEKVRKAKFKIGDIVRLTHYRDKFFKKNVRTNFKAELFRVSEVLYNSSPPAYRVVVAADSEIVHGLFYENEMQLVLPEKEEDDLKEKPCRK